MAHSVKKLPCGTLEVNIDADLWDQQEQEEIQFKQQWDQAMQGVADTPEAVLGRMMGMFGKTMSDVPPGMLPPGMQEDHVHTPGRFAGACHSPNYERYECALCGEEFYHRIANR